jgi:hypothetical protein
MDRTRRQRPLETALRVTASEGASTGAASARRPAAALLRATGCVLAVAAGCSATRDVEQPIAFEHKVHVADEEIPCTDCHLGAEEYDHATIPLAEVCRDCHEDPIGESPAEATLVAMLAEDQPIPWKRVHRLADHVHFSHRRHVLAGRILCETCHGEVAEREAPFSRPHISFNEELGMERCIACHLESGNPRASIDCALCHR